MIIDWKGDLAKEKSLWHVYRESKHLPKSAFNKFIYTIFGIAIAGACVVWLTEQEVEGSYRVVVLIADVAFDLSAQILGFLIGGFAIFATVTDDRLMIKLAQTPMGKGELSVFKYVFFNFLSVFYIFIASLSWSIIIKIISGVDFWDIEQSSRIQYGRQIITAINCVGFAIMSGLVVLSVVRLKSFIWNIYQAFITFLAVSSLLRKESGSFEQDDECQS